jgi:hypothetical protein
MCSAPQPPAPPDPRQTSAAATGTAVGTALANAALGNVNQITPQGTLTYNQTDTYDFTDPYTGQTYKIPRYTATQTLSPEEQALYQTGAQTRQNVANIGQAQSARIGTLLGTPLDLSNPAVENRLFDLASARLTPQLAQRRAAVEADLINRGIRPGSDAYDRAQTVLNQGENDAYNQLFLTGRGEAVQEALTARNQPINEITALMSGSQVAQPNYINPNEPTIPTTDTAGIINQNYQQRLQNYQIQQAQQQQMLGGLFGLGSAALMGPLF